MAGAFPLVDVLLQITDVLETINGIPPDKKAKSDEKDIMTRPDIKGGKVLCRIHVLLGKIGRIVSGKFSTCW